MFNRLLQLYPNAISASEPNNDLGYIWLKSDENYIGIPKSDLSEKERSLLHLLFPIENDVKSEPTISTFAKEWRNYLISNGPLPTTHTNYIRFIHFSIKNIRDVFQFDEWEEAVKSLFSNEVLIVPFSNNEGVIIEEQSNVSITEEELFSAIQAFESDFFFKIHFFIGRFQETNDSLKSLFTLEQSMLELSQSEHPEERIFTREKLMPLYLYQMIPKSEKNIMFADVHTLLKDDMELAETIKAYIENQSNATLTAKQLFMHRNSLQYRIDKFIEKTGIDIKTFHGAFFAYLACLHIDEK
ncbi:helix-turn-helix domain-containing protein [Bacillus sp. FJAT-49732]|uniref:Helix-turn-helix domain-containing protein n=1 Tax=Lederbergia citrisecunda TaxID=2833583 RepID=A0A942TJZ1_9BACI|nr:helix-turn-helix domain-containing protein [Lederbergia citrisecunda]MBS4198508.1 helix-turn-helix domain-containing protein [Lederbergia citrisecunda]